MIEQLKEIDFNTIDENGVNDLLEGLMKQDDEQLDESVSYMVDTKVEVNTDIPTALNTIINNERIAESLMRIESKINE